MAKYTQQLLCSLYFAETTDATEEGRESQGEQSLQVRQSQPTLQ